MDILKIKQFLSYDSGRYGYGGDCGKGDGLGAAYGCGIGCGKGSGCGSGWSKDDSFGFGIDWGNDNGYGTIYGNGYGAGDGNGYGTGYGIKSVNGYDIYRVDDTLTIFTRIHGSVAKGYILENGAVLKPCYIVKGNGYFAHGETLREAQSALEEKILDDMDIEEKIKSFKEKFPDVNKKYPVKDFYQWHHNLTGSCELGRKSFAKSHGIDIDNDTMTVKEFINLTESAYCGEIIKELKGVYNEQTMDDKRNTIS